MEESHLSKNDVQLLVDVTSNSNASSSLMGITGGGGTTPSTFKIIPQEMKESSNSTIEKVENNFDNLSVASPPPRLPLNEGYLSLILIKLYL